MIFLDFNNYPDYLERDTSLTDLTATTTWMMMMYVWCRKMFDQVVESTTTPKS